MGHSGDLLTFLIQSQAAFNETVRNDWYANKGVNPLHFGNDLAYIQIRINPKIRTQVLILVDISTK